MDKHEHMIHVPVEYKKAQEEDVSVRHDTSEMIDEVPGIDRNPLPEQKRHELGNAAIVKLGGLDEFAGNPNRAIGFDGTTKR